MIKYNPKIWFRPIFKITRTDTIFVMWKELIVISLVTAGIAWYKMTHFPESEMVESLMGVYSLVGF